MSLMTHLVNEVTLLDPTVLLGPVDAVGELAAKIDPGITPNSSLPFTTQLRRLAGGALTVLGIAAGLFVAFGAVVFVSGKVSRSQAAQQFGAGWLGWAMFGAVLISVASPMVAWITGLDFGF
ncbi:hypothetical protein SAMN06309944_0704 [Micrococcales bacterium KH10]|nr:hypothetical protein SAMN06309944_0704 [Micrococcales bacterium KH10]